jgi:hypothetical protein
MKKLLAGLLCSLIFGTSFSQDTKYYWDYEGASISSVMAKAGNSRIVIYDLPRCKSPDLCVQIKSKLLFNCSSSKVYSLGLLISDDLGKPSIEEFFDRDERLDLLIPKLKHTCSAKPTLKRASVFIAENQSLEGYFLVSDTVKKEGKVISAWIETKQFEKKLPDEYLSTPSSEIEEWMYSTVQKEKSYSSKFNWKINCENSSTAVVTSIAYRPDGTVAASDTFEKVKLKPVIPNTVGETILNNVCSMF